MTGYRLWLFLAGLNGLCAVTAGAYGWHALAGNDSGYRDIFNLGVDYQMWHALALLAVAWLADHRAGDKTVIIAGTAFTLGIVFFSGSLYALGLTGTVQIAGTAPIGGALFLIGWACFIWAAVKGV